MRPRPPLTRRHDRGSVRTSERSGKPSPVGVGLVPRRGCDMVLSDRDIRAAIEEGRIKIEPLPDLDSQLGSVSVDFRLGRTFMVFEHSRHSFIDPRRPQSIGEAMRTIVVDDDEPFIMQPGDFALASTIESLELPNDLLG